MVSAVATKVCPWVYTDLLCSRTSCLAKEGEFLAPLLHSQPLPSPVCEAIKTAGSPEFELDLSPVPVIFLISKMALVRPTLWGFVTIRGNGSKELPFGICSLLGSLIPASEFWGSYMCTKIPFPGA